MENKGEQELRFLQLRFIGKIIAGFTHEIKELHCHCQRIRRTDWGYDTLGEKDQ